MAEIKSFPNNQDEYIGAEYVMKWLHGRTSGVFGAEGKSAVSAVAEQMAVTVSDGEGWIANDNADGVVWWNDAEKTNGAKLQIAVDVADGVLDRIDRVIVSWETTNYVARPTITILKGALSSTPVAPALTNNSTIRQISLAQIYIAAGTLSLTNSMITDERLDASVCGIVTDRVDVDTSVIQGKITAMIAEMTVEVNETTSNVKSETDAVLLSIEQELAELEAGTAVELKKLQFNSTVVPVSAFLEDTTFEEEGFGYRVSVVLEGVISTMIPEVVFSMADAISGIFAPVAETYNGGVYLYASSVPDTDITVPTIICWRGNA